MSLCTGKQELKDSGCGIAKERRAIEKQRELEEARVKLGLPRVPSPPRRERKLRSRRQHAIELSTQENSQQPGQDADESQRRPRSPSLPSQPPSRAPSPPPPPPLQPSPTPAPAHAPPPPPPSSSSSSSLSSPSPSPSPPALSQPPSPPCRQSSSSSSSSSSSPSPPAEGAIVRIPKEILIEILANMGPAEQVNLARAGSQHFLTETFHLYVEDARIQLRWQRAPEGVAPRLILLGAIENGIPVGNIRQIVEAYMNVYAQGIDQIWGAIHSSHPPPLHVAIQNGRNDVVEMLLQLGANPDIRYWSYQDWPNGCIHEGVTHRECVGPNGPMARTCDDVVRWALRHAGNHVRYSEVHRGIENSLLALMRRGYSFDVFTGGLNPRISEDCSMALRANLANAVRTVLDDIVLRAGDDRQRRSLQQMPLTLLYAVCSYGQDGKEALIAWFFQHGVALRGPVNVVEAVVEQGKHRNAAFLLREQIRQDMFSHYDVGYISAIVIRDQHLDLTRAIVEALDHSAQMGRVLTSQRDGMRYTPGQVLSILLQNAVRWDAPETVKWLLEIGAVWAPDNEEFGPDPLVMAIRFGYRRVITMLMEDASLHIKDRYPDINCLVQGRTALDWAIHARRFGVLAYVLSRGPNRDVLPLEARVEACRWYRDVFGRPYNIPDYEWVVNRRNLASTAFLPDTRISDRRRSAMFRYILGTFRLS
ncbi:hypothetical protein DL767_001547 [Monosporascus sp. MG133]|nr:hypothetical protein DL767_001547 [Monosporascus sp. MG133]